MLHDVMVLGAGPAGFALAKALGARGLGVAIVDPRPGRPWPNRYGAWADELADLGLEGCARQEWASSELVLPEGEPIALPRRYVSVDGARLREVLDARGGDVGFVTGKVVELRHGPEATEVRLQEGASPRARVVVDATGHGSRFVQREGPPGAAWQIAYGIEHSDVQGPYPPDRMRFMDWQSHGPADEDARPTFLYAMPLRPGRWFFEETQLIGAPAMSVELLERRLAARLTRDGVRSFADPAAGIEHCRILMDPPLPRADQRVFGFGAAASLVHPATGYLLTRTLRAVEPVADTLAATLPQGPRPAVRAAWDTLWPADRRDAASLLRFGARALAGMDRTQIGTFYRAFFSLGPEAWATYLAGDAPPGELARVMLEVFQAAPLGMRARLAGGGLRDPLTLARGVAHLLT